MRQIAVLFFVLVLIGLACQATATPVTGVPAEPPAPALPRTPGNAPDASRPVVQAGRAGWALLDAIGDMVQIAAGVLPSTCLGTLCCLILPLALAGLVLVGNLERALEFLGLRGIMRLFSGK